MPPFRRNHDYERRMSEIVDSRIGGIARNQTPSAGIFLEGRSIILNCKSCDVEFTTTTRNVKYCEACRKKRRKEPGYVERA